MSWTIRLNRCDNRIRVTVNGDVAFERYYDFDPPLQIEEDLTRFFNKTENAVRVAGYNGPMLSGGNNPWHFELALVHNNNPGDPLSKRINESNASAGGASELLVLQQDYLLPP